MSIIAYFCNVRGLGYTLTFYVSYDISNPMLEMSVYGRGGPMSNFTYEFENRSESLEEYEWDYTWIDSADRSGLQRVLYIGDSISCATRLEATRVAKGVLYFDGIGTSKAVDNPCFPDLIRLIAKQEGNRCAIIFNNGLHGWHLEDETNYGVYYESLLNFLFAEFPGTPVFLALTTAVKSEKRNLRVVARNQTVLSLATKYNLPVIDLYSITDENRGLISQDGVHLTPEGYEKIATKIVSQLQEILQI